MGKKKNMIIPVLPIPDVVFFPNTSLPLYIEESSYIQMINDCIRDEKPIAVSLAQPLSGHAIHGKNISKIQYRPSRISGYGIPIIVEKYENNAIKILIKGMGRVKLHELVQNLPYPCFKAEFLNDLKEDLTYNQDYVDRINSILQTWISVNITNSIEQEAFYSNLKTTSDIVDYVAMLMIHDRDIRQLILESDSLFEKVSMVNALLEDTGRHLENIETVNAIKHFEFIEKLSKVAH
mgnify:CR=1 FL=1